MFKRKSKIKNLGSTESLNQIPEHEIRRMSRESSSPSLSSQGSPQREVYKPSRKEILKEIFKLPVNPKAKLNSELLTDPKGIVSEYLPVILKCLEWTFIFLAGYWGFSYAWIMTGLILYISQFSRYGGVGTSDSVADQETKMKNANLDSFPSWVVFPDIERVEWINTIMKKVWPNLGPISQQIAKTLVEPKVREILNRMRLEELSNFKLKQFYLGSIPARLGGIKVFDTNTGRDEIVMDVEVIFQGDASVNFTVQSFECEINQIFFRATARITIKPLLDSMPVVGGMELYFMKMPEYDYSLGKLASAADMPGISNIVKSVLDNIIRRGFVWPNRFSFYFPIEAVEKLTDQLFALPAPQGVVEIRVHQGRHLVKKDKHLIGGKSDPYVVISLGEKKVSFKDRYAECTVDPEWHYVAEIPVEEINGLDLHLEVFDHDATSEDDFMGRTCLPVKSIQQGAIAERWVRLDDTKHGEIQISAVWKPVHGVTTPRNCSSYVVAVYVDSCENLDSGKSTPPFSKCEISLSSPSQESSSPLSRKDSKVWKPSTKYEAFTTKPRGPTDNPVFQEGHFFLSKNPGFDSISVQIVDHRSGLLLGSTCVRISYLLGLPGEQFSRQPWTLNNSLNLNSTVVLSAKLYGVQE